jgi:uncharacterized protein with ParB-like and HNH nuclease domain/predicted transport protein
MEARETDFQRLMNSALQFVVPIYQRTYSWTEKQCKELWRDIISVANSEDRKHFIGSIVYIDCGVTIIGKPQQKLLIDGQQRITTVSILLCALARYISSNGLEDELGSNKIKNYFLLNNEEKGEDRYKLILTEQDRDTFIYLLEGMEDRLQEPSIRIKENFDLFQKLILESNQSVVKIFEGINKLMVVSVALDKNNDNPQLIFESMNSTGKDLSQADLIRNYILMDLTTEDQNRLYTQYWQPMERIFGQQGYVDNFDKFMRDFLTTQSISGRICKIGEVYETFKIYYGNEKDKEEVLKKLYTYSKYYTAIHLDKESDQDLRSLWRQIVTLDVNVSYPFLMRVYHDFELGIITKKDFITIIQATISYIVRRVICEIPTNSLNKTFATFYKKIKKQKYVQSVLAEYATKDSYRVFPTDEEIREKLLSKNIYILKIKNYILEMLENQSHKEPITITGLGLTVEHIMPQNPNLKKEWKEMLGENWEEIQRLYLHTIGNLTLTAYNRELSDRSFEEKKTIKGGFIDSHLRLNNDLCQLDIWNENTIIERTKRITDQIIKIWAYPDIDESDIKEYIENEKTETVYSEIDHYQSISEEIKEIYEQLERKLLTLDSAIRKEYKKHYIAFKVETNFADIKLFSDYIKIWLNMPFSEIIDEKNICKDVSNIGHLGNGEIEVKIVNVNEVDYVVQLISQALSYQLEG